MLYLKYWASDNEQTVKNQRAYKMQPTVPGEWSGGEHIRTTPWPSRTETALLVRPLKFSRSIKRTEHFSYIPKILNFVATDLHFISSCKADSSFFIP